MSPVLKLTNVRPNQSPDTPVQSAARWAQVNRALLQLTDVSYLQLTAWPLHAVSGAWAVGFTKHSKLHLVSVTLRAHLARVLKRLRYFSSLGSEWEKTTNFSGC